MGGALNTALGEVGSPERRALMQSDTLHIGFYRKGKADYPEDIVPPAVLRALAQHLKVDLETEGVFWGDYCFFAGVTGEAFRFLDVMVAPRQKDNRPLVERYGRITLAEMYRHALDAAGLEFELYAGLGASERETLRRRIVQSLSERRTPVIGLGGFDPPEPWLITGYDEDGEVLLGWSHFQDEAKNAPNVTFEPGGEIRLRNWHEALDGVLIVTGRGPAPARRTVYLDALRRAIGELGVTGGEGGELGTAAMAKWAAQLEASETFAGLSPDALAAAQSAHSATAGDHAERRALASSFVELAARFLPEASDDLHAAGAAFQGAHDTVYEFWETIARTGPFDPDLAKFADPARRRSMAALVRRLVVLDERARRYLERAVAVVDGAGPGEGVPPDALLDGTVRLTKAPGAVRGAAPPGGSWSPQTVHLPQAMRMLASFLGESLGRLVGTASVPDTVDYALWMGLTGAAFGPPGDGPERCNVALALDALGCDFELWLSRELAGETGLAGRAWGWDDNLRRRIFWNLRDRGLPVLLFNCGAWPDWYLVTGAEGWFTLYGYGGPRGDGELPGAPLDHRLNALRPIALFEGMKGRQTWTVNVTGKRTAVVAPEEAYRRAIAWGAAKLGAPGRRVLDPDHRERGEAELLERRSYGGVFLDLAADCLKDDRLRRAAERVRNVSRLVEQIWAVGGRPGSPEAAERYADAATRSAVAELVAEVEREDAAAAAHLAASVAG
ncbi:MAG TPA: hypothetical protein VFX49_17485 [Chloroflexota bacterium]|nr:hypothetical protein [Chloroflexota bacterium]